jgi:hypothetical protein
METSMIKPVKLSEGESLMLAILRAEKQPISSLDLSTKYYKTRGGTPFNARSSVISTVRSLNRKLHHNGEKLTVMQSKQSGPHPATFQLKQTRR